LDAASAADIIVDPAADTRHIKPEIEFPSAGMEIPG
jgi:hypothetical protein